MRTLNTLARVRAARLTQASDTEENVLDTAAARLSFEACFSTV